jgi:hypothetical protein
MAGDPCLPLGQVKLTPLPTAGKPTYRCASPGPTAAHPVALRAAGPICPGRWGRYAARHRMLALTLALGGARPHALNAGVARGEGEAVVPHRLTTKSRSQEVALVSSTANPLPSTAATTDLPRTTCGVQPARSPRSQTPSISSGSDANLAAPSAPWAPQG